MADALAVKQVNFKDGVHLHGVVTMSIGITGLPPGSLSGVRLCTGISIPERGPGVIIDMGGRRFLVPWGNVSSIELLTPEVTAGPPVQAAQIQKR